MNPVKEKNVIKGGRDPLWYRNVVIYQLHIKAFMDSNGDGIGDFKGLTSKLDYLQDLGVTAIWLLPFCPSPLKDDGYDIADYTGINPEYGSIRDFKRFLREAHKRGLRVISELVINHTSDQHPWFQRARKSKPGSKFRAYYVWSDTPERYQDARIIFNDFETSNWSWDPVAKAYYWHRFYSHQPDLNFRNPQVQKEIFKVLDFWFGLGVDGLRLDAVPYLFEKEGTNCENLPETHEFLKKLRAYVDSRFEDRMLLAEANQWPEDAAAYFGAGDECHMNFHFPLMPRLFMALRMEDRFPVVDILDQTPSIPDNCQWAIFLRNHDELTLEMVTDSERDYMYNSYAKDPRMRINLGIRRRLAPLLGNHRRRIELMNSLLFSLPGSPIIYYGDELGMGDNIYLGDRNGVRTPMQWSADRNGGFSRANAQSLYLPVITDPEYHYETYNVEAQQSNRHSLLWWMKKLISVRKHLKAFGYDTIDFIFPENNKVLAFIRSSDEQKILVVANLSRFVQYVHLDLSAYKGMKPVEVFGGTEFPIIQENPYFLSLSPHSFYWFILETPDTEVLQLQAEQVVELLDSITIRDTWTRVFAGANLFRLEAALLKYIRIRRWFRSKAKGVKNLGINDKIAITTGGREVFLVLIRIQFAHGEDEIYLLPITYAPARTSAEVIRQSGQAAIAQLQFEDSDENGWLLDAFFEKEFCADLLSILARRRRFQGEQGKLKAFSRKAVRQLIAAEGVSLEPRLLGVEQSNTSIVFGEAYVLKIFRRLDAGINPDLEIGSFLTEQGFEYSPRVKGYLQYETADGIICAGILHEFVPNQGDAWSYTQDILGSYLERIMALEPGVQKNLPAAVNILETREKDIPPAILDLLNPYTESARLLGQRAAQMHLALASARDNSSFAPEVFSALAQRSLYQSMRNLTMGVFQILTSRSRTLPQTIRAEAHKLMDQRNDVMARFNILKERRIATKIIRCHGDFHLGQVLHTGKDFIIIDFEGEPSRTLGERRAKRCPLTDVASMIRSFSYAAHSALFDHVGLREEDVPTLEPWVELWHKYVSALFLESYLQTAGEPPFLPRNREELKILLRAFLLEKAIYELGYELNNRPDWVAIPLKGIQDILED